MFELVWAICWGGVGYVCGLLLAYAIHDRGCKRQRDLFQKDFDAIISMARKSYGLGENENE